MKRKIFIKSIPFLSALIIITFIQITNKNESTKLKILIWNTPTLSLGTYLALSIGTGFISSYIFNSYISKDLYQSKIKYKVRSVSLDNDEETNEFLNTSNTVSYDKTLIERDINDPSPTIKAAFRIIGKTNLNEDLYPNTQKRNYTTSNSSNNYDNLNYGDKEVNENEHNTDIKTNQHTDDWYDETYNNW